MSEREDNVYKAKLAEQAERYDGMLKLTFETQYYLRFRLFKIADSANTKDTARLTESLFQILSSVLNFDCGVQSL